MPPLLLPLLLLLALPLVLLPVLPVLSQFPKNSTKTISNKYNPIWHRSQCCGVKWGARVLRVRSVSREEVWASAGVQGAWVSGLF